VKNPGSRSIVLVVGAALLVAMAVAPSQAKPRVGAPRIVAASPTSVTLDWSGHGSFRVYPSREGDVSKRSVKASTSKKKVTGLRPGTRYCFQVARPNGAGRSAAFCHPTPTRSNTTKTASLGVLTFNVCSTVCGRWPSRRAAVVRRIVESRADVVTLQEVSRRVPDLVESLRPHGFELLAETGNEAIFGRIGVVRREASVEPGCFREADQLHDSPRRGWDKSQRQLVGATTWVWDESQQLWIGTFVSCKQDWRVWTIDPVGRIELPNKRSAAFVSLLDIRSGRYVTIVTTHLTPGSEARAVRKRRQEASALTAAVRLQHTGPVVYTGDFNSSRARGHDVAGRELARDHQTDAYDLSTSYTKAWISSSNGFATRPRRSVRYGDHIDRIFVPRGFGVSDWEVVAPLKRGRNVRPLASDHHPVRATLWLP
jgi:endonuclease/exonuclease/phosphatase family metal-dependent hydrolase